MTPDSLCKSPDVFLHGFGLVWCEPTTAVTDLLLTGVVVLLGLRSTGGRARAWFFLMATALLAGGTQHLLHHELGDLVPVLTRLQNCASSAALGLLAGLLALGRSPQEWRRLELVYVSLAVGFVLAHLSLDTFWLTFAHQAIALLGAAALVLLQGRARSYTWYLASVGLGLVCALIYAVQLSPHPWFNHNDLAHLFMAPYFGAMWMQLRE